MLPKSILREALRLLGELLEMPMMGWLRCSLVRSELHSKLRSGGEEGVEREAKGDRNGPAPGNFFERSLTDLLLFAFKLQTRQHVE